MDNDDAMDAEAGPRITLARKSWTVYVLLVVIALVVGLPVVGLAWAYSALAGLIAVALVLGLLVFWIASVRSIELYCDDLGVWVYGGILPWSKGRNGVKWRDLDEASYTTGFWSWALRSYSLRVGHRFTKSSEMLLDAMANGDKAAMKINELHADMVRSGRLG